MSRPSGLKRKQIKFKDLTLIPISELPPKREIVGWHKIFSAVPSNKAVVIPAELANPSAARCALRQRQLKGLFLNIVMIERDGKSYIFHEEKSR